MKNSSNPDSPLILLVESHDADGASWFVEFPLYRGLVRVERMADADTALLGRRMTMAFATDAARRSPNYARVLSTARRNIIITRVPEAAS